MESLTPSFYFANEPERFHPIYIYFLFNAILYTFFRLFSFDILVRMDGLAYSKIPDRNGMV